MNASVVTTAARQPGQPVAVDLVEQDRWRGEVFARPFTAGAKLVAIAICHSVHRGGQHRELRGFCFAAQDTIGAMTGFGRRAVSDFVGELKAAGMVAVKRRKATSALISLTWPPPQETHAGAHLDPPKKCKNPPSRSAPQCAQPVRRTESIFSTESPVVRSAITPAPKSHAPVPGLISRTQDDSMTDASRRTASPGQLNDGEHLHDPVAFITWAGAEHPGGIVRQAHMRIVRSPAYRGLTEAEKDAIAELVEEVDPW